MKRPALGARLASLLGRFASTGVRAGDHHRTGDLGERLAARFLKSTGYRVLARNARTSAGEADLVALAPDRRTIVLIEVKTRTGNTGDAPPPEASIGPDKRRRLLAIARALRAANGWQDRPFRIDAVAVSIPARGEPAIRHFENAVRG